MVVPESSPVPEPEPEPEPESATVSVIVLSVDCLPDVYKRQGLDMQKLRDWELGDSLTSDDYLIVAGDFGFPWDFSAEECADIAWLESRPYTVLFVDGNHERFDHWAERPMELWHRCV